MTPTSPAGGGADQEAAPKSFRVTILQSSWSTAIILAVDEDEARAVAERLWLDNEAGFTPKGGDYEITDVEPVNDLP